jgi:hypothetical protein
VPAIRGCYTSYPTTGEIGIWVELSTDPPGTLTGLARTAWPSTAGKTLSQYQTLLNSTFQALCNLPAEGKLVFGALPPAGYSLDAQNRLVPMIVEIAITVTSLGPPVAYSVEIRDGAMRNRGAG